MAADDDISRRTCSWAPALSVLRARLPGNGDRPQRKCSESGAAVAHARRPAEL